MQKNESIFNQYGEFYDLFYHDKDYSKESDYILNLLKTSDPKALSMIELGSGSGNFSEHLTDAGFNVTGIEQSQSMLDQSIKKSIKNFAPHLGNIINFNLDKEFDVAVSLFDVMCYLTVTDDIISCLKSVNKHLKNGGYFIFDSWHTAGVYTSLPSVSIKRVENDSINITRIAEPEINYELSTVDVNYEFIIKNKTSNLLSTIYETHTLRHYSVVEVDFFAKLTGFRLIKSEELLTGEKATNTSWKVCHILQKYE
ncbi:class I SAM-dependent DNA methyltransferase [Pedobacter mucosus]|uniref:class I SAM-dependent DNA methyltransferase n=1 Tax=Pedobacter mucosus TaxID=2895286 RepID=UPI001EE49498|nr:class I SAM-dependent methyltransferase [Pedobacter mucosus]UKT63334.1 class I SAM-dependent methyltransferase [Pedobacter mucosus]